MNPDIRWKQRFANFEQAAQLLAEALRDGYAQLSLLEKEGVIQRFEYTLELAWKTVKDYLVENGVVISPVTPRFVLKEAFAAGIVPDGQVWIDMLNHRNLLSHTYDSRVFEEAVAAISSRYLTAFTALRAYLAPHILD